MIIKRFCHKELEHSFFNESWYQCWDNNIDPTDCKIKHKNWVAEYRWLSCNFIVPVKVSDCIHKKRPFKNSEDKTDESVADVDRGGESGEKVVFIYPELENEYEEGDWGRERNKEGIE